MSCSVEQPQACSISRSFIMAAPIQRPNHLQVLHLCSKHTPPALLEAGTSTRLESICRAPWSSRKLAPSVGASSWRLRCKGQTTSRCFICAASTLRPHCQRQRRAPTLSLPPIVEQPQACSISRSFIMAAPMQQPNHLQVLHLCSKHSPPTLPEARMSTHLESASHRGAAAS